MIQDYEFTRRARKQTNSLILRMSEPDATSDVLYEHLQKQSQIPFHLYLKRWIYRNAQLEGNFADIPEAEYVSIIRQSFYESHTPFTMEKTSKKPSAIIKGWLSRQNVHRTTIFLLGFGLKMTEEEVSEFLMKARRDCDFDFYDPDEVLFWFAIHNGMNYYEMRQLEQESLAITEAGGSKAYYESAACNPGQYLFRKEALYDYLAWLRTNAALREDAAYQAFARLYQGLGECMGDRETKRLAGRIEQLFCSGVPRTEQGNLHRFADSSLAAAFGGYRISRQRLEQVASRKVRVSRLDLITLSFFQYCMDEASEPADFFENCNQLLAACRMQELNYCNPYEVFLMLAVYSREPLDVYSDVLEISYENEE